MKKKNNNGNYHPGNKLNDLTGKEWIKFTKSWVICNPKPREKNEILHPAKFPEELIQDFIEFFTKSGDIVLDPFLGTGSTLIACANSRRSGIGIELNEKYANISKNRVKKSHSQIRGVEKLKELSGEVPNNIFLKILQGNSNKLVDMLRKEDIEKVDYCITSPPYWNMLRTSRGGVESVSKRRGKVGLDEYYSEYEEDLGNIDDYNEFVESLFHIFSQVHKVMKKGKYLTIITQNIRDETGNVKPLAWDLAKKLDGLFALKQEKIWCQDNKPLGIWGYPNEYVSNVHHHYCLIFKK